MKQRPEILTHVATLRHATDADAENHWDFEWVQLETTGGNSLDIELHECFDTSVLFCPCQCKIII